MGKLDDINQKIKGKIDQAKGEIDIKSGHGVKGGITKLKGKINESIADAKLNNDDKSGN